MKLIKHKMKLVRSIELTGAADIAEMSAMQSSFEIP